VPADPAVRAKRSAIAALIAFVDVPVVHFSVDWWRTLHQKGSVFNRELSPTIEGNLAWALLSGVFAFTFLYLYLLERRYRLAALEDRIEERILEAAIAERRAEADNPPVRVGS
jgi:heme exporter protein C